MRLALCRLCEYSDRLQASGNPVLFGLFNRMMTSEFPTRLGRCFLAVEVETDPNEAQREVPIEVRLIDEDGKILTNWQARLALGPHREPMVHRTFESIPMPWDDNFVFERPGTYRFDVVIYENSSESTILGGETLTIHGIVESDDAAE